MDFELSEELTMVRDMAREFARNELAPRATQHDRQGAISPEVFSGLAELGLFGLTVPEEYGGIGLSNLALVLVLEELNWACAATGVMLSVHNSLIGTPILKYGTPEVRDAWLPRIASGEAIGCYCLTEPNAGSDAGAIRATARLEGDEWVLDGQKIWVTNGGIAKVAIVYARSNPEIPGPKGISAFVVPMDTPGVTVGKTEKKTGIRASSTTEVILEGVRVPATHLLGEREKGFSIAMETLDGGRIGIAAQSLGIARACLEAAVTYSKQREQFGQPIGNFQAIQWKLSEMATRLDAARLLTYRAACKRDRGERCSQEAAEAKLFASQTANFAADECLQIHGGAGYTDDFHVERLFRDARITEIYEGTSEVQRIVISRGLLA